MRTDTAVRTRAEVLVSDYVRSVYNWMGIGLALTGFISMPLTAPNVIGTHRGISLLKTRMA